MSWRAVSYVIELFEDPAGRPISRTEKFVMLVLADHHNDSLNVAWPSLKRLSDLCLISKRSLIDVLKSLIVKDLLGVRQSVHIGRGHINEYVFKHLPPPRQKGEVTSPFIESKTDGKGEVGNTQRVKLETGKGEVLAPPKMNSSLRSKKDDPKQDMSGKPDGGDSLAVQAEGILAELNTLTGKHFRARESSGKPSASIDFIVARMKSGVTVEQCLRVVRLKVRQWKDIPDRRQYLRPATLFNREKFEQYLGELADHAQAAKADAARYRPRQAESPLLALERFMPTAEAMQGLRDAVKGSRPPEERKFE